MYVYRGRGRGGVPKGIGHKRKRSEIEDTSKVNQGRRSIRLAKKARVDYGEIATSKRVRNMDKEEMSD